MRTIAKISLVLLFAAAFCLIFIFSALGIKNSSQIFQTEFDNISYTLSGGNAYTTMHNGRIIAEYDDGYSLYNGHRRISRVYKSIRLVDAQNGVYEYTTYDEHIGVLDENGRQKSKKKYFGTPINDLVAAKSEFYIRYDMDKAVAVLALEDGELTSDRFDTIYPHSQANTIWAKSIQKNIVAGVFVAANGENRVLANVYNDKSLPLSSIVAIGENYLMAREGEAYNIYSLPQLAKVDTAVTENAFVGEGLFAYMADTYVVRAAGIGEYTLPFTPTTLEYSYGGNMFFIEPTNRTTAAIVSGGTVYSGEYTRTSLLGYRADRVGMNVFNSRLEKILTGNNIKLAHGEGRMFLIVGGMVYSYDNVYAQKIYDSASATHGDYSFLNRRLYTKSGSMIQEYKLYFNDGSAVYNAHGRLLNSHSKATLFADNLVGSADTYWDFAGNKTNSVQTYYKMYSPNGVANGEYVFKKADGFHTYSEKLFGVETVKAVNPVFVRNSRGAVTLISTDFIAVADKIYSRSDYRASGIFGEGAVFLATENEIKTLYYNGKKLVENTVAIDEFSSVNLSERGAVYSVSSGLRGFIDCEGKPRLDPLYAFIEPYKNALIVTGSKYKALFSLKGKQLTPFDYTQISEVGTFFFMERSNGKKELLNEDGRAALSSVSDRVIYVQNFVSYYNDMVQDFEYSYFFVRSNGKYRLIKAANEGMYDVTYNLWSA